MADKVCIEGTYNPDTGIVTLWRADDGEEFEVFHTDGTTFAPGVLEDFQQDPTGQLSNVAVKGETGT